MSTTLIDKRSGKRPTVDVVYSWLIAMHRHHPGSIDPKIAHRVFQLLGKHSVAGKTRAQLQARMRNSAWKNRGILGIA